MSSSFSVDKKLNAQFHRNAKIQKIASKEAKRNLQYLENEPDGYMIPENEIDKTLKVSQDYLKSILPKYNADNIFDLNLEDKAPFYIDYSRNGKYLLLAGEKGNISMLDWRDKNLITEFDTDSTISNIKYAYSCYISNSYTRQIIAVTFYFPALLTLFCSFYYFICNHKFSPFFK